MRYNYLAIEGNIGAGKTSLAKMIAEKYKASLILEQFADNPFLLKFYKDPERYSFPLELSFLTTRYYQLNREFMNNDRPASFKVADYILAKSLVFAGVTLQQDYFTLYSQLYHIIDHGLQKPDLLIFLSLPVNQLMNNIRIRGREYEKNISAEYLQKIQDSYMNWLHLQQNMKILMIEGEKIDFINNREDFNNIEEIIMRTEIDPGINKVVIS
jgi:deoxyguanosine kinase